MIPPGFVSLHKAYLKFAEVYAADAAGRLTFFLRTSELPVSNFYRDGTENKIAGVFWQNIADKLRLSIFNPEEDEAGIASTEYVVREADLNAILSPKDNSARPEPIETSPSPKVGRLPKYDWDAIWAGIVWIVVHEGMPQSQDMLIERVQLWYGEAIEKDVVPSRSVLQPKIAELFSRMLIPHPDFKETPPSKTSRRR